MMSRKHYAKAAGIIRAHDPELRTLLIDAFADFFRDDNPAFNVARFELECREGTRKQTREL